MNGKNVNKRLRIGLVPICGVVASMAAFTSPVMGDTTTYTLTADVCVTGFTCDMTGACWCEFVWDVATNWKKCVDDGQQVTCTDPSPDYPDASTDIVVITQNTAVSRCDGGIKNGEICASSSDCGGYDCKPAHYMVIQLTTETIGSLTIESASGTGAALYLQLKVKEGAGSAQTLTAADVTVDGVNGAVIVKITGTDVALKSDPND